MKLRLRIQVDDEPPLGAEIQDTDPAALYSEAQRVLDLFKEAALVVVKAKLAAEFLPPNLGNWSH